MARFNLELPSVSISFSQNVTRVCTEAMLAGTAVTDEWLAVQCEQFAWAAAGQAATLLMALFRNIHLLEFTTRYTAWKELETQEFWQKALYIKLALEIQTQQPLSRREEKYSAHPIEKRSLESLTSFVVIQRQKKTPNRLPLHSVKVYFPCCFMPTVLENLEYIKADGAKLAGMTVPEALEEDLVAAGSTIYDDQQQFATLVLRAGQTAFPRLLITDMNTPFGAGLFASQTAIRLSGAFGRTKLRIEVRSAAPEQFADNFDPEQDWNAHIPSQWDVMRLSPAEAINLAYRSCGPQHSESAIREEYGEAFGGLLEKVPLLNQALFPQDGKVQEWSRLRSIFEKGQVATENAPQIDFNRSRIQRDARQWQELLSQCGIDARHLSSQTFRPWESRASHTHDRERSRGPGKGRGNGKGTSQRSHSTGRGQGQGRWRYYTWCLSFSHIHDENTDGKWKVEPPQKKGKTEKTRGDVGASAIGHSPLPLFSFETFQP